MPFVKFEVPESGSTLHQLSVIVASCPSLRLAAAERNLSHAKKQRVWVTELRFPRVVTIQWSCSQLCDETAANQRTVVEIELLATVVWKRGCQPFSLPMFSKCDAPLNALPKGDLCDMIRHVCGAFTNQWAVVQIELLAKVGWHLPRNVTLELHQVLHLPRSVTLELHKVLHLPRNVTLELYQVLRRPRKVTLELHQVLRLPHKVTLELHQVLHWPRKVTLELHQVLGLPRKVTIEPHQLLHLPRKVIDNARSNRCHPPTSPNTAHATNNDIATFS